MISLLNEVFEDESIQSLPEKIIKEPVHFYKHIAEPESAQKDPKDENFRTDEEIMEYYCLTRSPDFINCVEMALEGTIFNLMQEINEEDFDCTVYPMLILPKNP